MSDVFLMANKNLKCVVFTIASFAIFRVKNVMFFYKWITVSQDMQKMSKHKKKISGCKNWTQNLESPRRSALTAWHRLANLFCGQTLPFSRTLYTWMRRSILIVIHFLSFHSRKRGEAFSQRFSSGIRWDISLILLSLSGTRHSSRRSLSHPL